MEFLNAAQTGALLPYSSLANAVREVLQDAAAFAPERSRLELPNGVLLFMPARDSKFAVTKLVTVHPRNVHLPTIQGEVILMDAYTGERLLMLDGVTVTARRTAAVSLLAAQTLAFAQGGNLLVVGTGTQARSHLEAFIEHYRLENIWVYGRNLEKAQALARDFGAVAVSSLEVLPEADFICTTTNSTSPVISDQVKPTAFIAAVGAFRPDMLEIPFTITKCAKIFVDDLEGAHTEAGDILQAGMDWTKIQSLRQALNTKRLEQLVLFKSVGCALWDLAAAKLAYTNMTAKGATSIRAKYKTEEHLV
ncbi:MAG: delta(1)-pyrroline-2-carboxylate reductase family protein [Deinococcales bacterium]